MAQAASYDPKSYKSSYGVVDDGKERPKGMDRAELDQLLKRSPYQHVGGIDPPNKFKTYYDLKPCKAAMHMGRNVKANQDYFAVAWETMGGSALAVFNHDAPGRANVKQPCIRGSKSLNCFALSRWDTGLVATGSNEGQVMLWRIPKGGLKADLLENQEVASIPVAGKVSIVEFHPYIDKVLVAVSTGFDGGRIDFFDITDEGKVEPKWQIPAPAEGVNDLSFNPNNHLIATTSKDGKARIIDPRNGSEVQVWAPPENFRDPTILWVDGTRLLTVGNGQNNLRTASLWNASDVSKPIYTEKEKIPNGLATLDPYYDETSGLLWLASQGAGTIYVFHLHPQEPYFEEVETYRAKVDITAHAFLPPGTNDVKQVEVARSVKLDADKVASLVRWVVPRKRLDFFQDDLFPPRRAGALMTVQEYFGGGYPDGREFETVSQQPAGMELLSTAPAEELSANQKRYLAHKAKVEAPKPKGILGHESSEEVAQHFRTVAKQMPTKNRWDAQVDNSKEEVDEDEWD